MLLWQFRNAKEDVKNHKELAELNAMQLRELGNNFQAAKQLLSESMKMLGDTTAARDRLNAHAVQQAVSFPSIPILIMAWHSKHA